jgi:(p)ppGpp synthase/HD superfamily hydrolase
LAGPAARETMSQNEERRTPDLGPRFDQALVLASELHRRQERKGRGTPYVSHLLAVCSIVLDNGGDEDEAIAALLHDAAEDQGGQTTLDMIEARFGPRVAGIVAACSDTFEVPKPPALERKRAYLAHLDGDGTSRSVLLVSAADKVHNLRSTLDDYNEIGPGLWARFKLSPPEQLWYYRSLSDIYDRRLGGPMARP